ncbi:MAG TPA: outer membrane beta-barrel protein [Chitinophagales bacterium]|nr:outer membrane beta-barrel protein [Chitinophagales bacterium]HNK89369.1 outer membrane beta-barrel protein [Chitinophagales bacterium]HNO48048.1 outer membrane beta-barrel protein [Chitinophagales bacterium]
MKRFLYVFALLFVFAEASAKVNYSIGFKGGLAFGRFKNFNLEGSKKSSLGGQYSSRVGLSGAITGRIWFNKYIGLEAGAEFNMGGNTSTWQQNFYGQFKKEVKENKFNYLTLPLVGHFGWSNERLKVFGTIGGYVAVPIHGRVGEIKYLDQDKVSEIHYDADFKKEYSRLDFGVRFGAGFEYAFSKNKRHAVTFDATYDWGLTKVLREAYANLDDKTNITNSRTLIQVGYAYKFGKEFPKKEKTTKEKVTKEKKVKAEKPAKVKEEKPAKVKEEKPAKVKEEKAPKVKEEKPAKVKEEKAPKVKEEKQPKTMTE